MTLFFFFVGFFAVLFYILNADFKVVDENWIFNFGALFENSFKMATGDNIDIIYKGINKKDGYSF